MRIVLAALMLLAGFVAVSLLNFWLAVRPPRIAIPLTPESYRLRVEDVTIRGEDGVKLAGWFLPRPGAPGIILLHGYPAEKADLLPLAAALEPHFALLLLDLRYFGRSEGRVTTLGIRERGDLERAVGFLERRGVTRVGVFGLSLGGAVGLLAAAEDPRIRAVAAYAPFSDLRMLGTELYARLWVLKYPMIELMLLWSRLFLGHDLTRPSPAEAARGLSIPVLLVHSREDEQIPFTHAERLRQALAGNPAAEFHFSDRGRHGELGPGFESRLVAFFERHLGTAVARDGGG